MLPLASEHERLPPVFAAVWRQREDVAVWLAQRIEEMEVSMVGLLSVAVPVNSEEKIDPVTEELGEALQKCNISVVACLMGRVADRIGDVCVFNAEHIK